MSWVLAMLAMCSALFLTASRAGFIDLVIAGSVCLWHFGVKGRRPHLIVIAVVLGTLIMVVGGRQLKDRFAAIAGGDLETTTETKAESSFEARKQLMIRALEVIGHYPILGTGVENFVIVSGDWHEVHMTYLQVAVEGGIPALVIYLMFFARGFSNLRRLRRRRDLDSETTLFIGALHSSLIGFAVGALFAPEAYQFFPYFAVAYTSVLLAIVKERDASSATPASFSSRTDRALVTYAIEPRSGSLAPQH
jgi:O-antigen ligase